MVNFYFYILKNVLVLLLFYFRSTFPPCISIQETEIAALMAGSSHCSLATPSPKRVRNAWFLKITRVGGVAEMTVMYKNTKNRVYPFSKSKPNDPIKFPWGTPVQCDYLVAKVDEESQGEFKFYSKRKDVEPFKESSLNSFEGGVNLFSKRVTALIVEQKQKLLSKYLSLLPHSVGFVHHREGFHTDEGFLLDRGDEVESVEDEIIQNGGSMVDYLEFIKYALESAVDVAAASKDGQDITRFFEPKRKSSEPHSKATKKSKAAIIDDNEAEELTDADGLETEFKDNYVGMANVPLENLSISSDLDVKLTMFRVYRIISSMEKKYDPSLTIAVVCPMEGQTVTDLKNVANQRFVVIQKIHTVAAFKEMDKSGGFSKLTSHQNRTVLCFVLRTNSAGMIQYGNCRANEIQNQFNKKTRPQDLLKIYQSLSVKSSPSSSMKVVERMTRLLRLGPNESAAVRKICGWSQDAFSALIMVIMQFERYESLDIDQTGGHGYQLKLAHGEKNVINNTMFKMLGKVGCDYFLAEHGKILANECSLKSFIEDYNTVKQVEKVGAVLSILAGYKQIEGLRQQYPDKLEEDQLKKYIGAEIKNGVKNDRAVELEAFYKSVVEGSVIKSVEVKFVAYEDFEKMCSEKNYFEEDDIVVLMMEYENKDLCFHFVNKSLLSKKSHWARLMLLSDEVQQHEVLSYLRSQEFNQDIAIIPLYFHCKPEISDGISENIQFAVAFGNFSVHLPPIQRYQSSVANICSIVEAISLPEVEHAAVVADAKTPLVQIHSKGLIAEVTYYGIMKRIEKFKDDLQKSFNLPVLVKGKDRSDGGSSTNTKEGDDESEGHDESEGEDVSEVDINSNRSDAVTAQVLSSNDPYKFETPSRKEIAGSAKSGGKGFLDRLEIAGAGV